MSSPSSTGGNNAIREGTRVILREITANLQNSPPSQSPRRKNGSESISIKKDQQQHDVKVTFIREFADAGSGSPGRDVPTESSLSSASSFQSVTSTLSSNSSSGICVDSSATKVSDTSYVSTDIPGLDDLISACERIRLTDRTLDLSKDLSLKLDRDEVEEHNLSGDQEFSSAVNSPNRTRDLSTISSPINTIAGNYQELDRTRNIHEETKNLSANNSFACATADVSEADRFQRADFELNSGAENFVTCVDNNSRIDNVSVELNESTQENIQVSDVPKIEGLQENFGTNEINNVDNDLQVNNSSVETLTPPKDEIDGNSTDTLPSPSKPTIDDIAVQFNEIRNFEIPAETKIVEEVTQSLFDATANVSSVFNDIDDFEISNFGDKETVPLESLDDLVVNGISNVDSLECFKPLSTISESDNNSHVPSLPTLSSVSFPVAFTDNDAPLDPEIAEAILPEVPVTPSLSETFDNIPSNDNLPINSESPVKEPILLNTQEFVEKSTDPKEPDQDIAAEISSVENTDKIIINSDQVAEDVKDLSELSDSKFCDIEKSEQSVIALNTTDAVVSPQNREIETEEIEKDSEIEAENSENSEFVDCREENRSADSHELNDTVTIQDINSEDILTIPESKQYADFTPKRQSTSLTQEQASTVNLNKSGDDNFLSRLIPSTNEYAAFVPQQQSTGLSSSEDRASHKLERQATPFVIANRPSPETTPDGHNNNPKSPRPILPIDNRCNFEKLQLEAQAVANDIYNVSLELEEEDNVHCVVKTAEEFYDPGGFDFLLSKTPRKNTRRDLRAESLYVKFDPLVSNTSMLPRENIQHRTPPVNEERHEDNNTTILSVNTPKRNPAIAAIDKLLFYSPMTTTASPTTNSATQKTNDSQEKTKAIEETNVETVNMAKELELVRSAVIELEEQVEKLKAEALENKSSYQEKINQLQTQIAHEIKNKNQITVVVDEYEKSISRLVAERERDRKNLDLEKAKLQEELVEARHHLDNTESAFNDVHLKYERLKTVVSTYKSNEIALKQSIQENVEIIKSLENRYEQVTEHATARLEKANQDLDSIRKQNESETVRLQAMLRKAELKSNSLAELVEQKTKENKELTQILDEVIARVGRNKSE